MKHAALVVVALVGCGSKNNCEPRKKEALDAVRAASVHVSTAHEDAKKAYEEIKTSHAHVHAGEAEVAERMKLFLQSMDCLVKTDCCQRLKKADLSQKTQVWSSLSDIFKSSLPEDVDKLMASLRARQEAAEDLATAKPAEIEAFCTGARADIEKIRGVDGAAAWKVARDALTTDLDKAKREVDDAKRRDDEIDAWEQAIKKNTKAVTVTDSGGPVTYDHARTKVNVYNDVCHGK